MFIDDDVGLLRALRRRTARYPEIELVTFSDTEVSRNELASLTPDLILVDLHMPRVDGITLCRTLKSDPRLCADIVIISGATTPEVDERSRDAGALCAVAKTFDLMSILGTVELERARRELEELDVLLLDLQLKYLARGTGDVSEKCRAITNDNETS